MSQVTTFPAQQLSFSAKTKEWRKKNVNWADSRTFFNYSLVRRSVLHKRINYDLINNKLHMKDLQLIVNPEHIEASFIPEQIQHYPIINSKLNVLRGEESKRLFDYKVIITNPNAVTEIEENKKQLMFQKIQQLIEDTSISDEAAQAEFQKVGEFFSYDWQDLREIRANALLNHYTKELNFGLKFNMGFMDALTVAEEIYQCDIVGGEPTLEKLNPLKVRIFKSGYSNKVEDADIIIIEDFWSPGKIMDHYYDVLTKEDIKYIETLPNTGGTATDSMDNYDERSSFISMDYVGTLDNDNNYFLDTYSLFSNTGMGNQMYYDSSGNIRVLKVFWKSRRKIKKVKSYDPTTGEEIYEFYPENYTINPNLGEEEQIFWINEAWEGTKIGAQIYVNMRPRLVQYNRISNPSRCHFGIIGSIYNLNDQRPVSLVDMMKPYNYLYDVVHDRLNKTLAANWGTLIELDFASMPKGWEVEKWLHYAKTNKLLVKDSFKEGNIGAATGKLAGNFSSNTRGVLNAELGNSIQQQINLLEYIKVEMAEVAGISKQREGQISNRETVGGVERATLQSAHITEWLFLIHEDVKKRVLECFLETAKIALKGRSKKFQYILPNSSTKIIEIEGEEFSELDYGLVLDNSGASQAMHNNLNTLAQAALQNQALSFSTIMKLYNNTSLAEKQRLIEKGERDMQERSSQAQEQQLQSQQQLTQMQQEVALRELQAKDNINIRDNETKLLIATLQNNSKSDLEDDGISEEIDKADLGEKIRQFDLRLALDKEKLTVDENIKKEQLDIKKRALTQKPSISNKSK